MVVVLAIVISFTKTYCVFGIRPCHSGLNPLNALWAFLSLGYNGVAAQLPNGNKYAFLVTSDIPKLRGLNVRLCLNQQ